MALPSDRGESSIEMHDRTGRDRTGHSMLGAIAPLGGAQLPMFSYAWSLIGEVRWPGDHMRRNKGQNSANEGSSSMRPRKAKIFFADAMFTERSAQEKNFSSSCSGVSGTCGVPLA